MTARQRGFLTFRVGQCTQRHHSAAPSSACQPGRRLTRSLDLSEEGLAMKATRMCTVDGCDRPHKAKGLCDSHYISVLKRAETRICSLGDCDRVLYRCGLCAMHDARLRRRGSLGPTKYTHGSLKWRFWRHVIQRGPEECWEWRSARNEHGYGRFENTYAHRVSYTLSVGPIPDGLNVMHACDNPPCVNPAHLSLGTRQDNMQDMIRKGRAGWQRRSA